MIQKLIHGHHMLDMLIPRNEHQLIGWLGKSTKAVLQNVMHLDVVFGGHVTVFL